MSNSGMIAAMGSVAAAIFFIAAVLCGLAPASRTSRIMFVVALILCAVYLFVSLFWGVRATSLESFQAKKGDQ
ncbi:MAG: hypothetical protein PHU85_19010 [Phycisphaerae bacterium]|nr:hypothetical protein [Phycisphaerae bacterium]